MEKEKFDFSFYLKFAKPLILNLPSTKDRVLASAWIKVLIEDEKIQPPTKLEYLKLLLFVIQRRRLMPPFTQHPATVEKLDEIPKDKTLVDVARELFEQAHEEERAQRFKHFVGYPKKCSPYVSDFSSDLLEYVSVQNIKDFGIHGYYAVSKEPITTWNRIYKGLLPKAAKSMIAVSYPPPAYNVGSGSTPKLPAKGSGSCICIIDVPPCETPEPPPKKEKPKPPKKDGKDCCNVGSPSAPIGVPAPPYDQLHPTWGSMLIEAQAQGLTIEDLIRDMTSPDNFVPSPCACQIVAAPVEVAYQSGSAPPPPLGRRGSKKSISAPRPTRSSLLRQQKQQKEAPPPPPPSRRPKRVPSKTKLTATPARGGKLSQVAKQSRQAIPKSHAAPVDLEKSIHMSSEAKQILGEIVDGPSTSSRGAASRRGQSTLRHPAPKHAQRRLVQDVGDGGDEDEGYVRGKPKTVLEPASMRDVPHKDPRVVRAFNDLLDTSMQLEMEEEDDFEDMERQIEAEMRARGEDPHEKGGIGYDDMEAMDRRESLDERIQRQQMRLEEESEGGDDDDFEAMERQIEAEMIAQGQDPHEKGGIGYDDMEAMDRRESLDERIRRQQISLQQDAQGGEGWSDEFFGMGAGGLLDDEFLNLDEMDFPDDSIEKHETSELQTTKKNYQHYQEYTPANIGVPVTVPRPTVAPRTRDADIKEAVRDMMRNSLPPSPPRTEDELRPIPSDMEEVTSRYPPETFQFQYETPPRQYETLKSAATIDTSQISPENKLWWTDVKDMQKRFHGSPQKTVPDIFDLPPMERLAAESPPKDWAPPVSPPPSPDLSKLLKMRLRQHKMVPERTEPVMFPYRNVRKLPPMSTPLLHDVREEYESPENKQPDVIDLLGDEMDETPPFWMQEPPPSFASPITPPHERIDPEELGREVQEGAVTPIYAYGRSKKTGRGRAQEGRPAGGVTRSRGRRPQLGYVSEAMEGMDESEWAHLGKMSAAPGRLPPKDFPIRVSRAPGLGQLPSSPIEYPDSPLTRRPAPESPRHVGPQRRTLRKKLKKRRLDFYEEPTEESQSEVVEVETAVEDRVLLSPSPHKYGEKLSPSRVHNMRRLFDLSPPRPYEMSPPPGSPRTPPRPPTPKGFLDESMPEVDDLPDFEPPSPMSEWGVLEGVMDEVKAHVPYEPSPPDTLVSLRQEWKRRPGKHLRKVKETHLEEEIYRIHEGVEAEVDEELAAEAAAARRAAEASLMDQPVPGGLGSPMRPPVTVPFYQTPPHLKPIPITRQYDPDVAKTANRLFNLQPTLREQEMAEMDEFERLEREAEEGGDLGLEPEATPYAQRTPPQMYMLPPAARMVVDRTAQRQYQQLRTPPETFEQFYDKIMAMPISPLEAPRLTEPGATTLEYEQTIREKVTGKAAGPSKPSKWTRAPKLAPRQLKKTMKQQLQQQQQQQPPPKAAAAAAPQKTKGPPKRKVREPLIPRKPLYQPPPPKERPSDKSLKSAKSKTSATSIPKKKKSKYNVPSKLDTGRGKPRVPKAAAAAKPPMEIPVDLPALQELGLTEQDLENMNLVEVPQAGSRSFEGSPIQLRVHQFNLPQKTYADLEAHTTYDPPRRQTVKTMKIMGRIVPLRVPPPPGFEMVTGEEEGYESPERIPPELVMYQRKAERDALRQFQMGQGIMDESSGVLYDDADTTVLDVVSAADPLAQDEEEAIEVAEAATSGNWGGDSPIPNEMRDFRWMEQTQVRGGKQPWDSEYDE